MGLSIEVNFKRRTGKVHNNVTATEEYLSIIAFKGLPGERDYSIDLSDVGLKRPALVSDYCFFLLSLSKNQTESTRRKSEQYFRYFINFLDVYEATFGVTITQLSELTTVITLGYGDWLDGDRHINSSLKLSPLTKNNRYTAIKRFIKYCQHAKHSRGRISQSIAFRTAWRAKPRQSSSRSSLSITDVAALRKACKDAIENVRCNLNRTTELINEPQVLVPDLYLTTSILPFRDPHVLLKAAAMAFEVNRLTGSFRGSMKGLSRALRPPYGETGAIISKMHFTTETLLPFIIMIGLLTCFNEIGLISLKRENVQRGLGILGDERIFVVGKKARAGRHQRRSFALDADDPYSVASLLETIITYSAPLRKHVERRFADTVFIAARLTGERPAGFFDEKNSVNRNLNRELTKFLSFHDIPRFNLNDLRTIGADVASMMSEGDTKVQQLVLQHVDIKTTQDHYQTQQAAAARQEQLAHLMNERERFIASGGRIDPRNAGGATGLYRAATPGLDCLDAMNSPIAGQRPGTLCSAYGKCFRCPRAVLFPSNANAARLLQMHERFIEARNTMNRARWSIEWEAEHLMLRDFWLLLVPAKELEEARSFELPPIPPIE